MPFVLINIKMDKAKTIGTMKCIHVNIKVFLIVRCYKKYIIAEIIIMMTPSK